jgi:hypothetical protein
LELAPLLDHVTGGGTLLDALSALPQSVPTVERLRVAAWLFENGVLTCEDSAEPRRTERGSDRGPTS